MDDRQVLMKRVQVTGFAMAELGMYLDTHPDDQNALQLYSQYQKLNMQAQSDYVKKFGPIIAEQYNGSPRWMWIDNPWPWELESQV